MRQLQKFINWQAAAIKKADPCAVVTSGSYWVGANVDGVHNEIPNTAKPTRNWYSDECLLKAGGREEGTLDFYQIHSYDKAGPPYRPQGYLPEEPFHMWAPHKAADYFLDKPLVVGEFSSYHHPTSVGDYLGNMNIPHQVHPMDKTGFYWTAEEQYKHLFGNNYSGGWYWVLDHDDLIQEYITSHPWTGAFDILMPTVATINGWPLFPWLTPYIPDSLRVAAKGMRALSAHSDWNARGRVEMPTTAKYDECTEPWERFPNDFPDGKRRAPRRGAPPSADAPVLRPVVAVGVAAAGAALIAAAARRRRGAAGEAGPAPMSPMSELAEPLRSPVVKDVDV